VRRERLRRPPLARTRDTLRAVHDPAKTGRRQAPGIERAGDHGLGLQASALQPADDAARLLGPARVEGGACMQRRLRMRASMPAHEQVEGVRPPASIRGFEPLPIEGGCEISIGRHTSRAQLIQKKAKL